MLTQLQQEYRKTILPLVSRRQNWLTEAFTLWTPALEYRDPTKIYELRTYHLKPGHLLEWERDWYVHLSDPGAPGSKHAAPLRTRSEHGTRPWAACTPSSTSGSIPRWLHANRPAQPHGKSRYVLLLTRHGAVP